MFNPMPALTRVAASALFGAALLPLLSANPASALIITVAGINYDVSTIDTSHASQPTTFGQPPIGLMPWWGDDILASTFATTVFNQLGPGWDADYGPVFAYALDAPPNVVLGLTSSLTNVSDQPDVFPSTTASVRYAIATSTLATPVPAPLPLLGAVAAYGCSRRLRARLRRR